MNIFDFALKMEKDGEGFYREIAAKTKNKGLQVILTMLADEEVKHYKAIESMKLDNYEMAETSILNKAKNIFVEMKEQEQEFETDKEQIVLYEKAQEIEKKSQDFYNEKAQQADSQEQKNLFVELAKEEEKHYFLLENIIKFVSKPKQWLEDAEWNHLEEY
ncbi:MAG: ferritin family protein [Sedimentisphaerales bacterium]|nr:ferritin family protein [Sedimentisphaerales bacterium]